MTPPLHGSMRALATLCVAGWLGLSTACGRGESGTPGAWRGTIDTLPNGTVIVHNPAAGVWDSATAWTLVEELAIGSVEGTGPEVFGNVMALEVDGAGRIYVLDRQAQEIRLFDAGGSYVRSIGRKGSGPGEFKDAIGLAFSPGGVLWVVDPGNGRYAAFDTAGHYLRLARRPVGGYTVPWPGIIDTAGGLYEVAFAPAFGRVVLRFDSGFRRVDTMPLPSYEPPYFELRSNGGMIRTDVPFSPSLLWRLDRRGYLWTAISDRYRIVQQTLGGDTVRIVERAHESLPVTAADRDSAFAQLEWFRRQGGQVDVSRFPATKPALRAFEVGDDGHLWVRPTVRHGEREVWDVFDAEGRYIGGIAPPAALSYVELRGDLMYGLRHDELGVEYVVRWRIRKPPQ